MSTLLFYEKIATLDRERHGKTRLEPSSSKAFAAGTPFVPLVGTEFADAAREYAIAFLRGADGKLLPVALTGAPGGRNVYVDSAGQWSARYVPAYVRRYPFVFAETAPDQLTVCIDEACHGFNESRGAPLFEADGEPSPLLDDAIKLLSEFQRQAKQTQGFVALLEAAGLFVEANARADLGDGRRLELDGFWIVDEARFRALPEATLKDWFASGELGLVYAHLFSLGNLLELVRRAPQDAAAATPPDTSRKASRAKRSTTSVATH